MFRAVLVGVALLLGLAFHSRNHQAVTLDFYTGKVDLPLSWLVVAALMVGALAGALTILPRLLSVRRALRGELKRAQIIAEAAPPTSPSDGH